MFSPSAVAEFSPASVGCSEETFLRLRKAREEPSEPSVGRAYKSAERAYNFAEFV